VRTVAFIYFSVRLKDLTLFESVFLPMIYSIVIQGKFYEMFHMDADIGVQICGLSYMKGHVAHAGFPEISYGTMADKLVRAGYKVARVEQTETPEQLGIRKKTCGRGSQVPKVVNREVCSILTMGTRTFCYLDDESCLLHDEATATTTAGPLLSIREVLLTEEEEIAGDNVEPVCEYGVTIVDAIRGTITIGQFADDILRSRFVTLLTSFAPSEVSVKLLTSCSWDTATLQLLTVRFIFLGFFVPS
jgi:DNA mismatch repair protein MSH6